MSRRISTFNNAVILKGGAALISPLTTSSGNCCCSSSSSSSSSSSTTSSLTPVCTICTGIIPAQLQLDLQGFVNGFTAPPVGDCATIIDGTWILDWYESCRWRSQLYEPPYETGTLARIYAEYKLISIPLSYQLEVIVETKHSVTDNFLFRKDFGATQQDCNAWSNQALDTTVIDGSSCNRFFDPLPTAHITSL